MRRLKLSGWSKLVIIGLVPIGVISCGLVPKKYEANEFVEIVFFIDGEIEVQLSLPSDGNDPKYREYFISTAEDKVQRIFISRYDRGIWKHRDLRRTRLSGTIIRMDKEGPISLDDIKNDVYLSRPDYGREVVVIGKEEVAGNLWLKVKLTHDSRGESFAMPVGKSHALILTMTRFDEDADVSAHFKARQETLKRVVSTLRISSLWE